MENKESLERECQRLIHDLVHLADLLESEEGPSRRSIAREYKLTSTAYLSAKKKLDNLKP
jgi:hypothetical protein